MWNFWRNKEAVAREVAAVKKAYEALGSPECSSVVSENMGPNIQVTTRNWTWCCRYMEVTKNSNRKRIMRLFDKLWNLCKYIITGIPPLEQKQESYNIPVKDKLIIVLTLGVKNVHIEKQYDLYIKLEDFCNRKLDNSVVVLKAFDFDRPMCIEWSVLSSKNMSEEELTKFIERTEKAAAEYLECLQQNK